MFQLSTNILLALMASSTTLSAPLFANESNRTRVEHIHHPHEVKRDTSILGDLKAYATPDSKFEDGTIKCSAFPTGQGVIPVDWLGFDSWTTITDGSAVPASSCEEGHFCSYACQPGMSKTQYPSYQPVSGSSIGGLLCKNGYLYRTNTDADYLCEWGVDSAEVVSTISDSVSICRTDYPGSENMVIPTVVNGGASQLLTVVNEDSYYQWEGLKTSAQYYVNNAGISPSDGCIWGTESGTVGNWAPIEFGAGYSSGISYLSLIPNPNNRQGANFNVRIEANPGSTILGECKYENGLFNGGADGCTVSVTSGKAKFVIY